MKKSAKLALFFSVMFTFVSCQGFLQSESIKNEIYSVIEYNNAPSYKIKFDSEKNKGTFKAPSGIEVQKKVTDEFTVSFAPAGDYDFLYWKIMDAATKTEYPNGEYLTLESVTSDTTTCKFTKAPQNGIQLTLFAVVAKRPRIISKTPAADSVTYRDTRIRIVFDKPMDKQSIYFDPIDEIPALEKQLDITINNFVNAGDSTNPKYYCYYYNGKKYFKNIQIVNTNAPDTSMLEYFDAPYFEDLSTLIIPPSQYKQVPANTTITVTLETGFSYTYSYSGIEKQLMLKEDEIWLYSVNSSTDSDGPSGTETITDSNGNDISKNSANPTSLYQQKLKMYVDVRDTGSGPLNTFKIFFENTDPESDKLEAVTIPYDSFNTSTGGAFLGKENEKVEYKFTSIPDGTYKMYFIYYDKNSNPSKQNNIYYVKIDSTAPTVTDIELNTYTRDPTSTANGKTALKLTYTCEDTDFEKVIATWYPADGSEAPDTATFQKGNSDCIIKNLIFGKQYKVDLEFYKTNGNCYTIQQTARATYDYVKDFTITGRNKNNTGAEVTLSWERPKGEFDSYKIVYKFASNTSNNYDKEYEVDNSKTEYTIPDLLLLNREYTFGIRTYSAGSCNGPNKTYTTPIHTIEIDTINVRTKEKDPDKGNPYIEVCSTKINSSTDYNVVMYYSNQSFTRDEVTTSNINSGRIKYVSLETKYTYSQRYYVSTYDANKTAIADDKYFKFGSTYYFLISTSLGTQTQWSTIKDYTVAYTVENLQINTDQRKAKIPYVSSKKAWITWSYPKGLNGKIIDWIKVFVNGNSEPVWSQNNKTINWTSVGELLVENLTPDSDNTIEVQISYKGAIGSQSLNIKTLKEIPNLSAYSIYHTKNDYYFISCNWNTPDDTPDRYVFMCKEESSSSSFAYTNTLASDPYLYVNGTWIVGIEGTSSSFALETFGGNNLQENKTYEIFVIGYKLVNGQPVAVVSEWIPITITN